MIVGRWLGWLIVILGVVVLGRDLLGWLDMHRFEPVVIGQLWYDIHRGSLNFAQAIIQRYVWTKLWDPVITSILLLWAAPVFIVIGLALALLFRRRENGAAWRRRQ